MGLRDGAQHPRECGMADDVSASASSIPYSSSGRGWETQSGTAMPPARQMPHCTAA